MQDLITIVSYWIVATVGFSWAYMIALFIMDELLWRDVRKAIDELNKTIWRDDPCKITRDDFRNL